MKEKNANTWRAIQAVVAILLLILNIYQFTVKLSDEKAKDFLNKELARQAIEYALKLSGAYSQIEAHQRQVNHLHGRIENAETIAAQKGKLADKYYNEYEFYKWQYDEMVQEVKPFNLSNDEHVKFFLNWAK